MSIIRLNKKKDNFVILDKRFLEDTSISLKLKGFLAYCLAKPDHWEFHVSHLVTVLKEGKESIYNVIDEGIEAAYIEREQLLDHKGKFLPFNYIIHEIPIQKKLPLRGFPDASITQPSNQTLVSTDSSKERKQQPTPAAVVVYPHLNKLEISESLKQKISKDYPPEEIQLAVSRCLKWQGRESDEAAIIVILKRKSEWKDHVSKDEIQEKNSRYLAQLAHLDGKIVSNYLCVISNKWIQFAGGQTQKTYSIDDKDFIDKVNKIIGK